MRSNDPVLLSERTVRTAKSSEMETNPFLLGTDYMARVFMEIGHCIGTSGTSKVVWGQKCVFCTIDFGSPKVSNGSGARRLAHKDSGPYSREQE
jgi:hypothetical protein